MRRKIMLIAVTLLLLSMNALECRANAPELSLEGKSAILMHLESTRILYSKDADRPMYPASTTKIMTALLTLEHGRLNDLVKVGPEVYFTPEDGSLIEIKPGDSISVRDLLHGLMLRSGNDAAYTLGVYVARRVSANPKMSAAQAIAYFVDMMNDRATQIGANKTHFANPDGYHHPNHWTTAYDLALIAREAIQHQLLLKIATTTSYVPISWQQDGEPVEWKSGNRLLDATNEYYLHGSTGLKPGYTPEAGFCQVATATRQGLSLISVVLKSSGKGRWIDSTALLEHGFANYESVKVAQRTRQVAKANISNPFVSAARVVPAEDVTLAVEQGKASRIIQDVQWNEGAITQTERALRLQIPAVRSMAVGRAVYSLDGQQLAEVELVIGGLQAGWLRYLVVAGSWVLLAWALLARGGRRS